MFGRLRHGPTLNLTLPKREQTFCKRKSGARLHGADRAWRVAMAKNTSGPHRRGPRSPAISSSIATTCRWRNVLPEHLEFSLTESDSRRPLREFGLVIGSGHNNAARSHKRYDLLEVTGISKQTAARQIRASFAIISIRMHITMGRQRGAQICGRSNEKCRPYRFSLDHGVNHSCVERGH